MITAFLVQYDYISSGSAPGYTTDEILLFINNAQDEFIKERMFGKNFQPPAFEQNQKRVADLQTLINSVALSAYNTGTAYYGESRYTIPTSPAFLYYIDVLATVSRSAYPSMTSKIVKCEYINHASAPKYLDSEINRTHFINPVAWIDNGLLHIIKDRFTTLSLVSLVYIKKPNAIANNSSSPSVPLHTHTEIVDLAVWKALQVTGDPRWQTATAEKQLKTE